MNAPGLASFAAWASACLLNALWQVALVFCAAWSAARLARMFGPRAEHRVWVTALLLECVLPFCHLHPELWWNKLRALLAGADSGSVSVSISTEALQAAPHSWLPGWAQMSLSLLFLLAFVYAALRLAWNLGQTLCLLRRASETMPTGELARLLSASAAALGVDVSRVHVLRIQDLHGPATVGLWRHALLLPADLMESDAAQQESHSQEAHDDLATTLAHELVHIRRMDFAKNLLYELLSLPIAWHPLLLVTRAQVNETRELASDAEAAKVLEGNTTYARSLVRIAARIAVRPVPRPLQAVGIYDTNIFERRIMHLMQKPERVSPLRRLAAVAACALIAVATCYTAMALQANVTPATPAANQTPKHVVVSPGQAAQNLVSKVAPLYPPEAKQAGIQGTVVLHAVISKDGHIRDLKVVSGPEELSKPAQDAVQQWVYKPYLLNGSPVEVETRINVIYTLGDHKPMAEPASEPAPGPAPAAAPAPAAQTPPMPLTEISAPFPPEAKAAHQNGVVIVTAKIDPEGHPTVLAAKGPDAFLKNAREAVEKVSFKPATQNGGPVEATVNIEVNFKHY